MYRTAVVVSLDVAGLARAEERKVAATWNSVNQPASAVSFSADGKSLGVASGSVVKAWDLAASKPRPVTLSHRQTVGALAPAADGKSLTTLAADGTLGVWDLPAGKARATVRLRLG